MLWVSLFSMGGSIQCTSRLGDGTHSIERWGLPALEIAGYQKVTTDISHAGRIPRPISPGGLIVSGTVVRPFPRNTEKASVVGYYKHGGFPHAITLRHTRSRFVPPGDVESGAITAFVIGPSQRVPKKTTLQGNLCMSMLSISML